MTHRYVEAAKRYMNAVVSGAVPACKWTRLAVERQLQDLQRPVSAEWPYVFDAERAVLYYIVQMLINNRLEHKHLPSDSDYYDPLSYVDDRGNYVGSHMQEKETEE